MTVNRRNAMVFLGLASASSAALATDAMLESEKDNLQTGAGDFAGGKRMADALRRLADGIERKEVDVVDFGVDSRVKPDDIVYQTLTVNFYLNS